MKTREASHYRVEGYNPHWNDPLYLAAVNTTFKQMRPWQKKCLERATTKNGKIVRFLAVQAFCGSGKSILQVHLAVADVVSSGYTQKQLITVPQEHIHRGFFGEDDLDYVSIVQNGVEYQWSIQADHNFCDGKDRLAGLKDWLLTPVRELAKGFTDKTIGGLNAVCSHSALTRVWKDLTDDEKRRAVMNLTLRVDEAHHIKHVFLDDELSDEEQVAADWDATELGKLCAYILNTDIGTCKLHTTSATMYRGDRKMIWFPGARGKFVVYCLDWVEHWNSLGIEKFILQYEEYDKNDPVAQVVRRIREEPKEKHYVVVPSTGSKWRDETALARLLKEVHKVYPRERVLDLVTKETQEDNKKKLLSEPKSRDDKTPSRFDVVVVCMLGREGTDWCPCSRIHNTAIEKSITLAVQTAGRAFRRYEGKTDVKIYHYVQRFAKPREGITKRELLSDRTNALLFCMQLDEMNNPIIIPAIPQAPGEKGLAKRSPTILQDVFGGEDVSVKKALMYDYECLEEKSVANIREIAERICEEHNITENREGVVEALVARLVRWVAPSPEFRGVNAFYFRENGYDKFIKLDRSIYCGEYEGDDWLIFRKFLQELRKTIDEWVIVAGRLAGESGGVLPSPGWLQENGYTGLYQAMRRNPKAFDNLKKEFGRTRKFSARKSSGDRLEEVKQLTEENGGVLPSPGWLQDNGHGGLYQKMRRCPKAFDDVKQERKRGEWEKYIDDAKKLEKRYGSVPAPGWLQKNGYTGLYKAMRKNPGAFAGIQKECARAITVVPRKTLTERVDEARQVADENGGVLPSPSWLQRNGHTGLYQAILKNRKEFEEIKFSNGWWTRGDSTSRSQFGSSLSKAIADDQIAL